jgi:hypothetical protein
MKHPSQHLVSLIILIAALLLGAAAAPAWADCAEPGWAPTHINLKDHTVFLYRDHYYLASIASPPAYDEDRFAYARSTDLCTWEDLGYILTNRSVGGWDDEQIWAPFVYEEDGIFWMFYTSVTTGKAQSILLATSTDPANPASWQAQSVILQPSHPGMIWEGRGTWSDARDPMVLKAGDRYYMYYTGLDAGGGIVGVATAERLVGPWRDQGATLTVPGAMLESPGVIENKGWYYLYYNRVKDRTGPAVQVGPSPLGPWSLPRPLGPGWAHEFWRARNGRWMASYLTVPDITIRPVSWNPYSQPVWPMIGARINYTWLPSVPR